MKWSALLVGGLLFFAFVAAVLIPSLLRTENSAKNSADQILRDELEQADIRVDAFRFAGMTRSGLDWIATWQPVGVSTAAVGVSITPFDAKMWGKPLVPNCKEDRARTMAAFGDICAARR